MEQVSRWRATEAPSCWMVSLRCLTTQVPSRCARRPAPVGASFRGRRCLAVWRWALGVLTYLMITSRIRAAPRGFRCQLLVEWLHLAIGDFQHPLAGARGSSMRSVLITIGYRLIEMVLFCAHTSGRWI